MQSAFRRFALFATLVLAAACGCTSGTATVSGKVTLDGTPVPEGAVQFFPEDGKGVTKAGIIQGGAYTTEMPPGKYKVMITWEKVVGKKKPSETGGTAADLILEQQIPEKYNADSELVREVKGGQNDIDFHLTRK